MAHIQKKLNCSKEKWRKILKCLFLIEHLLRTGSNSFVDSMRQMTYQLKNLNTFSYIDETRADKGETSKIKYFYYFSKRKIKSHFKIIRRQRCFK
ncbi:MAG: hypothetical protein MJ252_18490 [archaeon]|nr:hypothetical protein [archaeon]